MTDLSDRAGYLGGIRFEIYRMTGKVRSKVIFTCVYKYRCKGLSPLILRSLILRELNVTLHRKSFLEHMFVKEVKLTKDMAKPI